MRLRAFFFALVRVWVNVSDFDLLKAVKRGKTFGKAQIFFPTAKVRLFRVISKFS